VCLIRDERRGKGGVSDLYGEFCGGSLAELEYLLIISWLILEIIVSLILMLGVHIC
jgi:hypothetical protein